MTENTLLDLQKRKELEKDKKREDESIKDVKNIFRLKKEIADNTTKSIRNLVFDYFDSVFQCKNTLKNGTEAIKDKITGHIRNLFEQEKEDFY